jgi:predicted nucleic acid-binding protein
LELADTSAWTNRHKDPSVDRDFEERVIADEIGTCPMVVMELLWTTQNQRAFEELRRDLDALARFPNDQDCWDRALDVWTELVAQGGHRHVKIPDLLIAATAEIEGIAVCHYDADFDVIAGITGQPVRAIAPIGSL